MTMETTEILDEYARNLLAELSTNARASYADLGRRVGLSPSAVAERMRRMEEDGVIKGYSVEINPETLGLPVLAVIRMTCDGTHYHPFLKFVKSPRRRSWISNASSSACCPTESPPPAWFSPRR